jgi:hypothetical protein
VDSDNYWHGWHWMASQLQAWEAAATLELQRGQERRNPDLAEDAAYLDAIVCVRKAEMAHKGGHASEAASLVQNAINLLRDAAPDQQVDFDRWMTLADHVLPLAPQSLPALLMACEQLGVLEIPAFAGRQGASPGQDRAAAGPGLRAGRSAGGGPAAGPSGTLRPDG